MNQVPAFRMRPAALSRVKIEGGFWGARIETNRSVTLAIEYDQLKKTGRIDQFKMRWKPGMTPVPHKFWTAQTAKWIEAAAYSLVHHPDPALERRLDRLIGEMAQAQQPDGYLGVCFTLVAPEQRWTNLRDNHEMFACGHLAEAAVAHYEATGKRSLLDIACCFADHVAERFGPRPGQRRGYPGHEEIELALARLYRATGQRRYLDLAKFVDDERGQRRPKTGHYYEWEARQRGEDPSPWMHAAHGEFERNQSHLPVREQKDAVGHAVKACYLYSGMADVAAETSDRELLRACERLWDSVTRRRMYVTGGIGSAKEGERFTFDYDLPNESAYAETCAAIALVFFAHRMAQITGDGRYADVMERALYNGVLSGVSLSGDRFLYANPLAVHPNMRIDRPGGSVALSRREWFGTPCCPPNLARLLPSFGQYVYSESADTVWVHLYAGGSARLDLGGRAVTLTQRTDYPWKETVRLRVDPAAATPATFAVALRIPGWCRRARLSVNGHPLALRPILKTGYAFIRREWRRGDRIELTLPMPPERIEAHPKVRMNNGRVTLMRGPLVYCLEQVDNGPDLNAVSLPREAAIRARFDKDVMGGVVLLTAKGHRRPDREWKDSLYRAVTGAARSQSVPLTAVPYCLWNNRGDGEMLVWIRED